MTLKEIILDIVIPIFCGLLGGSISSIIIINKNSDKRIMNNKNINIEGGDIINGNKK